MYKYQCKCPECNQYNRIVIRYSVINYVECPECGEELILIPNDEFVLEDN